MNIYGAQIRYPRSDGGSVAIFYVWPVVRLCMSGAVCRYTRIPMAAVLDTSANCRSSCAAEKDFLHRSYTRAIRPAMATRAHNFAAARGHLQRHRVATRRGRFQSRDQRPFNGLVTRSSLHHHQRRTRDRSHPHQGRVGGAEPVVRVSLLIYSDIYARSPSPPPDITAAVPQQPPSPMPNARWIGHHRGNSRRRCSLHSHHSGGRLRFPRKGCLISALCRVTGPSSPIVVVVLHSSFKSLVNVIKCTY